MNPLPWKLSVDLLAVLQKKSQSNYMCFHFEEFSNVHQSNSVPNATRSKFAYKDVITFDPSFL